MYDQPQKKPMNPLVIIMIIFMVVVCGGGICVFGSCAAVLGSAADAANSKLEAQRDSIHARQDLKRASEKKEKPIAVTADKLWKDYRENTVSADDRYKDKLLRVRGVVDRVEESFGTYNVVLSSEKDQSSPVMVMLRYDVSFREAVKELKNGYVYELDGVCSGERATVVMLDGKSQP